jgi:tetratricopeptide (TPR) repeat protein
MSSKIPTVRQTSWPLMIPGLVILGLLALLSLAIWGKQFDFAAVGIGAAIYLVYAHTARWFLIKFHRKGMRLIRRGQTKEAIEQFKAGYQFFSDHSWIDKLRSVTVVSASAMSFREIALVNIAVCYGQLGDKVNMKKYYEQALKEFPDSSMAKTALNLIATIEKPE